MSNVKSCLLVGVGGQGAILICKIMSNGFMKAGYVHESSRVLFDDKVDIAKWKKFFDDGGSKISFIYKRRYDKEFYQSYVEIVRGNEYHPDRQIIFLFVKNLEIK